MKTAGDKTKLIRHIKKCLREYEVRYDPGSWENFKNIAKEQSILEAVIFP